LQKQTQPPRSQSNPQQGGAPNGGGNPLGNDTAALSADQRGAIGDHVRECWTYDAGALGVAQMQVMLTVTTDPAGVARLAQVAGSDLGRLGDPVFRAFAERAVRAVLDPHCAGLPLPQKMLGKTNVLTFLFKP
jgi:neural Wiskott-Aldrich syndrome protein